MINFYDYYNNTGLDNQHYAPLIGQLIAYDYTNEMAPVEHIIKIHPYRAYMYARHIIRDRWLEAEPYIMKDFYWAYFYSLNVMGGRWLEAEPYIMENKHMWSCYCKSFKI